MREFEAGSLGEDYVFNDDETLFFVNINYGRTLAMKGDKEVMFGDVVSGDVGMAMMVTLGGCSKARLQVPFMIFKNDN